MHSSAFGATAAIAPEADILKSVQGGLYINGSWKESAGQKRFAVHDPSTEAELMQIADASVSDALAALESASNAQPVWAARPPRERGEILRTAFEMLIAQADEFATLIALEMGKSVRDAHGEVAYAAEFLRWFSEETVRIHGRYQLAPNGKLQHIIAKKAVGPCLLITPWNFPLAMITRKVGPAVAAGCTMLLKPAQLTPLTASRFVSLMHNAGLPAGVLNFLPAVKSSEIVNALMADSRLKKVSFTGSTRVGKLILKNASANVLRTSMELGGNAPFIVFEDADLDAAVDGAMQAKLRNIGQACTAANRFYIHETIVDDFTDRLRQKFSALRLGRAVSDPDIIGPLISASARKDVHGMVLDAVDRRARLITGGELQEGPGYFYPPTILSDVPDEARVMREEIFGPVAPIQSFVEEDEVLKRANSSEYGLASYVYTRDLDRTLRIRAKLEAGMLGVNAGVISDPVAPFGGVKHSGLGREGGFEGIEEYLSTQYTAINSRQ